MLTALQARADAADGLDWVVSMDSSISPVHQHGATTARSGGRVGDDADRPEGRAG